MNYQPDPSNPYAAPTAGAEAGGKRGFAFTDEVRKLISTTATLMIVAGILQMIPGVAGLVTEGFSGATLLRAMLFGVIPAFTAIAGFSLRALDKPGDDLGALLSGVRQLFVAYLIKGVVLLLVIGSMLLMLLFAFLGAGVGFFKMWG